METVEMTLEQLADASSALEELSKKPLPPKAAYKVAKLRRAVKLETESLEEARKQMMSHIEEFETKRLQMLFEYADKNEDGSPVVSGSQFVISDPEKLEEFNKKFEELREEYKEEIEAFEEAQKEFEALAKERQSFDLPVISIDDLPDNIEITPETLERLGDLITE